VNRRRRRMRTRKVLPPADMAKHVAQKKRASLHVSVDAPFDAQLRAVKSVTGQFAERTDNNSFTQTARSLAAERELRREAHAAVRVLAAFLEADETSSCATGELTAGKQQEGSVPKEGRDGDPILPSMMRKIAKQVIDVIHMLAASQGQIDDGPGEGCVDAARVQLEMALDEVDIVPIALNLAEKSRRQWVIDVVPTTDRARHGTVARIYRKGYEWRNTVLVPQTVALYRYQDQ
jgi:hypothetical protein